MITDYQKIGRDSIISKNQTTSIPITLSALRTLMISEMMLSTLPTVPAVLPATAILPPLLVGYSSIAFFAFLMDTPEKIKPAIL